jgi:hypothetical protein
MNVSFIDGLGRIRELPLYRVRAEKLIGHPRFPRAVIEAAAYQVLTKCVSSMATASRARRPPEQSP